LLLYPAILKLTRFPILRDTVQSTGVLMSRSLPFTDANTLVKTFRHALALDEVYLAHCPHRFVLTLIDSTALNSGQTSIIVLAQTNPIQNM